MGKDDTARAKYEINNGLIRRKINNIIPCVGPDLFSTIRMNNYALLLLSQIAGRPSQIIK